MEDLAHKNLVRLLANSHHPHCHYGSGRDRTGLELLSDLSTSKRINCGMLWVDKHRPHRLDDLSYHSDTTQRLRALAAHPDTMPHLFLYGPSGSGKKTRIAALLRELYGPGADKLKLDKRTFTTPTKQYPIKSTDNQPFLRFDIMSKLAINTVEIGKNKT